LHANGGQTEWQLQAARGLDINQREAERDEIWRIVLSANVYFLSEQASSIMPRHSLPVNQCLT